VPEQAPFISLLVAFGNELRTAGVAVGTGDVETYCAAVAVLDPTDIADLYWSGRTTLLTRRDQIPVYDRVFRRFFLADSDDADPLKTTLRVTAGSQLEMELPAGEPAGDGHDEEQATLGLMASDVAVLREKSFAACTPEELAALRRIIARVRLTPPRRRTRRTAPARAGHRPDMRRTVRETMRAHGEPAELFWRRRQLRTRPLVLILDVSGSMSDYSRSLLQFAHSTARAATARVEVFCFGTRLTRITRALEHRRPDVALAQAAGAVFDWDGGTRIGDSLETFVRVWGRRGVGRGGIVVICSDGLDRGDPGVLAEAMERLSRLCHRIVWLNPHKGHDADFQPSTLGMMVASPFVDLLLSGHDLRSLEEFAARLPELG